MSKERVLVVGDCHVDDTQDLSRFEALGKYILEQRPTHIVMIGDFLSMHCFSNWDRDKRAKMEGLRYAAEIAAGNEALDLMFGPVNAYNKTKKRSKKAQYKPELIYIEGNHEERERRYLDYNPELIGTLDYRAALRLKERGFKFIPYRSYHYINEVGFTHIPMNKMNKPAGGMRVMTTSLQMHAHSVVFGHTHELKIDGEHRHGAKHFNQALNVGCFFEHVDDYALGSKTDYWRGVIMLDMYSPNRFDYNTMSLGRLAKEY